MRNRVTAEPQQGGELLGSQQPIGGSQPPIGGSQPPSSGMETIIVIIVFWFILLILQYF